MKYVYFARVAGTDGPIKIGCSACPEGRCKQLGFDYAARIELIAKVPGDLFLERNLHLKFAENRTAAPLRPGRDVPGKTEWFAPCAELESLIHQAKTTGKINLGMDECRERAIAARYKAGETLQQIGASYGITRERVRQILNTLKVPRRSAVERAYVERLAREKRYRAWLDSRGIAA